MGGGGGGGGGGGRASGYTVLVCFLLFLGGFSFSIGAMATLASRSEDWRKGGEGILVSQETGTGFLYTRGVGRCTPQFWSSKIETWPKMVPQAASLSKVFGSIALEHYEPGLTLLEATQRNDDIHSSAFSKLIKQSSAALLNAYARPDFSYDAWEVKTLLIQALVSEEAAASQAEQFAKANEACN